MTPLVTAGELQTYVQRPIDAAASALAVELASGAIRASCGWNITEEAATFTLGGSGFRVLGLPTLLLTAVAAVELDGQLLDTAANAGDQGYTWSPRGQLLRAAGWPMFSTVVVNCTHGYNPIPDVVRLVALGYAARAVSNPERYTHKAVGSVTQTFDLTELDGRLLDPYRLP